MAIFKELKRCILSFGLLMGILATSLVSAEHHQKFHYCGSHKNNEFKLEEFAGDWVVIAESVGGISGNSGFAFSSISHLKFEKNGEGFSDFSDDVTYTGPVGTPLRVQAGSEGQLPVILELKNPKLGTGIWTVKGGGVIGDIHFDFIAIKSPSGEVVELNGQGIDPNFAGFPTHITRYTMKRQFPKG